MKIQFQNESFEILKLYQDGRAWSFESHFYDAPRIAHLLVQVRVEFQCLDSHIEEGINRIATKRFQFLTPCWITRSYFPVNAHELSYCGQPVARCATEEALTAALRLFQGS